jgi:hypothetical protein
MKKFGDLKKGDSVFRAIMGPKRWKIYTIKVLDVKSNFPYEDTIILTLDNNALSGIFPKDLSSNGRHLLWTNYEEAINHVLEVAKRKRNELNKTIDNLILEYDEVEKFIQKYDK